VRFVLFVYIGIIFAITLRIITLSSITHIHALYGN